jgi:hypothetical protein
MASNFRNHAVETEPAVPYPASESDESELGRTFKRLDEISALERNWDSYGSEPPTVDARAKARTLITSLYRTLRATAGQNAIPFAVVPLSGGGVQIEWRSRAGAIEVEIGPETYGYLLVQGTGADRSFLEGDGVSESRILELVSSIVVE